MKNVLCVALVLALLSTPTLAQNRPFRLTVTLIPKNTLYGQGGGGLSLDIKQKALSVPGSILSIFYDGRSHEGINCGAGSGSSSGSDNHLGGFSGYGLSLRKTLGNQLWGGMGLGNYVTEYVSCGTQSSRGPGGKVFVGVGQGLLFTELTATNSGVLKNTQFSLSIGVRL